MFDAITNAVTAFNTFAELQAACQTGYVPTIYPKSRRARILRQILNAHAIRVWPKM